jgi:hypothetical protein
MKMGIVSAEFQDMNALYPEVFASGGDVGDAGLTVHWNIINVETRTKCTHVVPFMPLDEVSSSS